MKYFLPLLSLFCTINTIALASPSASPRTQTRIFALALTLRACDLRSQDYIETIQSLQTIDDTEALNSQIKNSSREAARLRHTQSDAYALAAQMLTRLGAPTNLQEWAIQTAARFKAPLVYDDTARKMAKNEPESGLVMAELGELESVNAASAAQQPALGLWLNLTGGAVAVWTADIGSYAADLRRADLLAGQSHLLGHAALRLLLKAPSDSPSAIRGDLSELAPKSRGNLSDMATVLPSVPHERAQRIYTKLVDDYDAKTQVEGLDKTH